MLFEHQVTLVNTILAASVGIASILFAVMGFMYSVFTTFVRPLHPRTDPAVVRSLEEEDWRPPPIIETLRYGARWLVISLGFAVILVVGSCLWFRFPTLWLLVSLTSGLIVESFFLFLMGCWVVFKLMRI